MTKEFIVKFFTRNPINHDLIFSHYFDDICYLVITPYSSFKFDINININEISCLGVNKKYIFIQLNTGDKILFKKGDDKT